MDSENSSSNKQEPISDDLTIVETPIQTSSAWEDCLLFFYGTLTIPHVLQEVLALSAIPTLIPASIHSYTIKLWGPYPALVPSNSVSRVGGMVFKVETRKQLHKLERYEGGNYLLKRCRVKVGDEDALVDGWTFVWDGTDGELKEGTFDANMFPKRMNRRRGAA